MKTDELCKAIEKICDALNDGNLNQAKRIQLETKLEKICIEYYRQRTLSA